MSCLEGSLRTTSKSKAPQEVFGRSRRRECGPGVRHRKVCTLPLPLGIIEAIHAASQGISWRAVLSAMSSPKVNNEGQLEKKFKRAIASITFSETDLEGTSQSHDDALVVTCRIGGFLVKRVMVDQGNMA